MKADAEVFFSENKDVMKTSELRQAGIYYQKLQELLEAGTVTRIRRGYYQFTGESTFSDIPALTALFPDGVICMESALDYYGYTDRTPSAWHLAVESKSTRTRFRIDYPIVKPHFIKEERYPLGITAGEIDGFVVKVYDRERTICDLLHHRNKVDSEVFGTAVQRYIRDPEKVTSRLMQYAERLHVDKKVQEVLGPWL